MADPLRVRFGQEAAPWIRRIKGEELAELCQVKGLRVEANGSGSYRVRAEVRVETYARHKSVGWRDETVEMELRLVPPAPERLWYVEITKLTRLGSEQFRARASMEKGG